MAPVVRALGRTPGITARICLTGQHREMLDQVTALFGLCPDADLDVMRRARGLSPITAAVMGGLGPVLDRLRPDCVLVHGDTTTAMAAALAAFHARIPVGHVEAGLRTGDVTQPWPEEMNRRLIGRLATVHFAPTERAAANLCAENVDPARIEVTGNTAIDALGWVRGELEAHPGAAAGMAARFAWLDDPGQSGARRLVLATGHRRENHGGGLAGVCDALARLAARGDVQVVWPVHPSPQVAPVIRGRLAGVPGVHLVAPQGYRAFAWLMGRAHLIVTDSGGIQEEAPALGTPVLVTRETTERPEAVEAGTVRLVGTAPDRITAAAARLLDDPAAHAAMARCRNPYGDGRAAERIRDRLVREFAR